MRLTGDVEAIDVEDRRARLGLRHHLASPARRVEEAAASVVGLHSSDPVSVYLAAWARVDGFTVDDLEHALYDERSLVRTLGMRRTMFVVPVDLVATIDVACTQRIAATERARLVKLLEDQSDVARPAAWLKRVEKATLAALEAAGEATANELTAVVPELRHKFSFGEGKKWAGSMGLSTRVLFLLAAEGRVVRGRPRGSWISSQYRWAPIDRWIDGGLPVVDPEHARVDLTRRWLHAFGPATANDLKWWTGWTVANTKAALEDVAAVEVGIGEERGFVLPDDVGSVAPPDSWVALLPALDPTVMGWKERSWYLGPHGSELFDRNGNAGPTVWVDGRVVGGWGRRKDGSIAVELLERVPKATRARIQDEAERLRAWLGDVGFTPRFRTPLEQRLTG